MAVTVTIHTGYAGYLHAVYFGPLAEVFVTADTNGDLIFDVTLPDGTYTYNWSLNDAGQTVTGNGTYTVVNPVPVPPPVEEVPIYIVALIALGVAVGGYAVWRVLR